VLATADVYVSPELLAEYREVPEQLRASRKITVDQRRLLVGGIAAFVSEARLVVPTKHVALCRDPADDPLLECCRAARAAVLVTGDRDLLDLAATVRGVAGLRRLAILTPRAFLDWRPAPAARKR
jgi:putative PIN family toxin of toxin-antitoxin system